MAGMVTESDILAWIEGELPEERASAVEAAFNEDPSLRARALSMQDDRATLRAWAERAVASAPGGLAQSALEIVEREALLGPSEAELLASIPEREAPARVLRIRRYATAAVIVLMVGALAVTGVRFIPGAWRGPLEQEVVRIYPDPTLLAQEDEPASEPPSDLLDVIAMAGRDASGELTLNDFGFDEQQIASATARSESLVFPDSDSAGMSRPMGLPRDLAALVEDVLGRDAIAGGPVIAVTPEHAARSVERLVVRVWADDPVALSRAMQLRCKAPDSPAIGWSLIADGADPGAAVKGAVCTVRVPGEAAGLEWLAQAIREAGAERVALTLRNNGTTPSSADKGGSMDAAGALWWGEPISVWAPSVRVGVLIAPSEGAGVE